MVRTFVLLAMAASTVAAQSAPRPAAQPSPQPAASPVPVPGRPHEIAAGTFLLDGAMYPDRGPDGNTVILVAPDGLVVVDTGRHSWHSDAVLAFARERKQPIVAIVNTHWHLDHSSGNRRVKAAYPAARVYTTSAVNQAIAPGGFLARNLAAAKEMADPAMPAVEREERDLFIGTMDAADALRPDVAVDRSGPLSLAGRPLAVHVTDHAVSAADLWFFDEKTQVAVIGDLVTFPVPFFETACPAKWQASLDDVWATPFTQAIPGHGAPMTRAQFDTYRKAFGAFRSCVGGETAAAECASGWSRDIAPFLATEQQRDRATRSAAYYVDFLRKGGGASPDCAAK